VKFKKLEEKLSDCFETLRTRELFIILTAKQNVNIFFFNIEKIGLFNASLKDYGEMERNSNRILIYAT
jgi:hypothetical protein